MNIYRLLRFNDRKGPIAALAAVVLCLGWAAAGSAAPDQSFTLSHQGIERHYQLHLPVGPAASGPRPLVISLHGNKQTLDSLRDWLRFEAVSDRENFVVAYPEALDLRWSYGRPIVAPMPQVGGKPADDVGFIAALIAKLVADGIADADRIYVAGLSRGGLMSFTLACALSDRIAAAAPMITGMTEHQRDNCHPARPVPLLVVARSADLIQRYDGWLAIRGRLLSVPETLEFWRVLHGCTGQRTAPLRHLNRNDHTGVGVVRWTGCRGDEPLIYYRVFRGGHRLPSLAPPDPGPPGPLGRRNRDFETGEVVWDFFRNRRLPH